MCERLIRLRPYLSLLENEGEVAFTNLSNSHWTVVEDLTTLLKPFMVAQKLLEGHTYVTISLVPYMIYKMRKGLCEAIEAHESEYVRSISNLMLLTFNKHFGTGIDGTVAQENLIEGARRRPKGISMLALMASLLDPRMKGGVGISPADNLFVIERIRDEMRLIAMEEVSQMEDQHAVANTKNTALQPEQFELREGRRIRNADDDVDMFDELNEHFRNQQQQQVNEPTNAAGVALDEAIDAELTLYKGEPSISLKDHEGNYRNPLFWWSVHQRKYKYLSILASRLLCIPATSAPSERVFSAAGLTITKDRARLASDTANELIFLHEVLPSIEKIEACTTSTFKSSIP